MLTGPNDPDLGKDKWLELGKPYPAADGGADLAFSMDGGKLHTYRVGRGQGTSLSGGPEKANDGGTSLNQIAEANIKARSMGYKDGEGPRLPDFYSLNTTIAIPNPITATLVGWSGNVTIDRHGQIFFSPIGVSVGKSTFFGSASLTANWIAQSKIPSAIETYNFLSGHGISIGGGYIGGVNWSISPANNGTKNAFGFGLYTPQIGASYNYTPEIFIKK